MFTVCSQAFPSMDIAVMSAAVADYTPTTVADQKIKKQAGHFELPLTKTKDILRYAGEQKTPGQFLVGFALETHDEKENALAKLRSKHADCIVLNSMNDAGAGFGGDTNAVTILAKSGAEISLALASKKEIAKNIVSFIVTQIHAQ
jgi:phosphopantothenoylcysteine decarboxylase/phosphopantothenate--cysteine ligase